MTHGPGGAARRLVFRYVVNGPDRARGLYAGESADSPYLAASSGHT